MPPNQIHQGYWLVAAWWLLVGKYGVAGVVMVVALLLVAFVVLLKVKLSLVVSVAMLDVLPVMAIPRQMRASMMTPTTKEITEDFTGEWRRRPR